MKAADLCIREIDALAVVTDSTVVARLDAVLDDLEARCQSPTEAVLALEKVYAGFASRRRSIIATPFGRYIARRIDERQNLILQVAA